MRSNATLIGLLLLALVAACGSPVPAGETSPATPPVTSSSAAPSTAPTPVAKQVSWRLPYAPMIAPKLVDGVVVVGYMRDDLPRIAALDLADGAAIWERTLSPAQVLRGLAMQFHVHDDQVVFLEQQKTPEVIARLTTVKAATGEVIGSLAPRAFTSYPGSCDDDENQICIRDEYTEWRLSEDRQQLVIKPTATQVKDLRYVQDIGGGGLIRYFPATSDDLHIGVLKDGKLLWGRSEKDLFGGSYSTNFGWYFHRTKDGSAYVVSIYEDGVRTDTSVAEDLSKVRMLSFRASDGQVLWVKPGYSDGCRYKIDVPALPGSPVDWPTVGCRLTGMMTYRTGSEAAEGTITSETFFGYDPATGAIVWETPVPADKTLFGFGAGEQGVLTVDDTHLGLKVGSGSVLNLVDGQLRPATSADVAWRPVEESFPYPVAYYTDGKGKTIRGATRYEPVLLATGAPASFLTEIPSAISKRIGDRIFVMHTNALVVYVCRPVIPESAYPVDQTGAPVPLRPADVRGLEATMNHILEGEEDGSGGHLYDVVARKMIEGKIAFPQGWDAGRIQRACELTISGCERVHRAGTKFYLVRNVSGVEVVVQVAIRTRSVVVVTAHPTRGRGVCGSK